MNILFLDRNPYTCARWHCDQHVTEKIVEYAQLLSTVWKFYAEDQPVCHIGTETKVEWTKRPDCKEILKRCFKPVSYDDPCALWVQDSRMNYNYLVRLFDSLCYEYQRRFSTNLSIPIGEVVKHKAYTHFFSAMPIPHGWAQFSESVWNLCHPPPMYRSYSARDHKVIFEPPQIMPGEFKGDDVFDAYKLYYKYGSDNSHKRYRKGVRPCWLNDISTEHTDREFMWDRDQVPNDIYTYYRKEENGHYF
tara:strand:+ start:719 stop:1462 length:744 start_codon:yes stop_codon:yes gene_type:complete